MATTDKYDRQTRLWGANGQRLLGNAFIVMIGCSPAGTETLKNLVLPGAGKFLIVDDKKVCKRDLGNDFFVTPESVGQLKAKVVSEMMKEMNPDVQVGNYLEMSAADFLEKTDIVTGANLVIACEVDNNIAAKLGDICYPTSIPLIVIRQYGLLGYIRLQKRENCIVEPKIAMKKIKDIRVHKPWEELEQYAMSFDFQTMEEMEHNHTPYAVILIQAIKKWRAENDGKDPKTFPEKKKFREETIKSLARFGGAQNFAEAKTSYVEAYKTDDIEPKLQEVFDNPESENKEQKSNFWMLVKALKTFYAQEGRLCVSGVIPDMIGETSVYLKLQKIYIAKAEEDRAKMKEIVKAIIKERGAEPIPEEEFVLFCKNTMNLQVDTYTSISKELAEPNWEDVADDMSMGPEATCARFAIAMRAFEQAWAAGNTHLGELDENQASDLEILKPIAKAITEQIDGKPEVEEKYLKEILRYGRCHIHNIASILGGVASQEGCKLIMSQYTPFTSTFVFDGIHSRGMVYKI